MCGDCSYHFGVRTASAPPAPASALIGRGAEIESVCDLLGGARLVTLTGPPGVGKTRLALAVAAIVAERFADGAVWVDLTPVRDARQVLPEIARVLDARTDPSVLLVLDNCEHVLDAAPQIGELLMSTARLSILTTSRERLRLSAEHEYAVPPLPMPSEPEVSDWQHLRANPAIAMLLARAPANVKLNAQTARPLTEICIRLDGLPLALELAAARLRIFTPSELAFRLEHRTTLLTGSSRDAPARHRDLQAAIGWSHALLSDRDREVFRRLSVFPADWTVAAADAVCGGSVLDAIESLLDKSLLHRVPQDGAEARFTMLMSLREFAAEQLDDDEEAQARTRHTAYFVGRAREWERTIATADEDAAWVLFNTIRPDLQAAFEQSQAGTDVDAILWLTVALGWYQYTRGSLVDAQRLIKQVERSAADPRPSTDARTAALIAAGAVAFGLRDLAAAERTLRQSADLAEGRGDERRLGIAVAFLGHLARERGEYEEAGRRYEAARTIFVRLGNSRGVAWAAHDLGLLAIEVGQDERAEALFREALRLFDEMDYPWAIAGSARGLATVLVRRGEQNESAATFGRALALHDQVDDLRGIAECLEGLAEVSFVRGAAADAARLLGAAQMQRARGAAPPTDAERGRLTDLDARIARTLGASRADHERQAGRTMPRSAVLELAVRIAAVQSDSAVTVRLTSRQWEVAELIAAGNTNRQISRKLGISEKTTEIHVHNIMERLNATSRAGIAAWIARHGLQRTP